MEKILIDTHVIGKGSGRTVIKVTAESIDKSIINDMNVWNCIVEKSIIENVSDDYINERMTLICKKEVIIKSVTIPTLEQVIEGLKRRESLMETLNNLL